MAAQAEVYYNYLGHPVMAFSFRIDPRTAAKIRRLARARGWTQSAVVREAVAEYGEPGPDAPATSLRERLAPFIGVISTHQQLSTDTHAKYRAALERKRERIRRSR
jgi:hypothetical protein